ncbi:Ig-like domain-containing protein [Arthrobacter humicola]|uniref:Bacterial Ig-like domain-containing protein n=1 Tax=Arthrobacter humicola TaxID=409291 RepID=A0ABP5KW03_9MICC
MSRRNTRQAHPSIRSRVAVIVAGVALLSWAGPGANAFWASVANGGSAAAAADAVAAGATPSASVSAGNVTLAWKAAATLAGRPVSGYTLARYASASGGTRIAAGGTCTGTVTAGLGCTDQGVPTGTWYYTVTPVLGQWQGPESVRSAGAAVDTTPPAAPTVSAPAYVNSATVATVPVSGTTEPGASIALTVKDAGTPVHTVTAAVTADASGAWNTAVNLSSLADGTLTYSAVATDTAGNQGNPTPPGTVTSVKDVTAPTVSGVVLADGGGKGGKIEPGDKATITFFEALDSSTICSSWAPGAAGTLSGDNQVTVTISAGNVLSVSVDSSACPTSRIGSVALAGNYSPSGTLTYKGAGGSASTVSWSPATRMLTITLGALATGSANNGTVKAAVPTYTPTGGMRDVAGNALAVTPVAGSSSSF